MDLIYLDHNATTPVDPAVAEAMMPFLTAGFGNASSAHSFGREAKVALENSREQVAAFINCDPSEVYFTSGGTESDNLAVMGAAIQRLSKQNHLVVGAAEHPAVLEPAQFLASTHGLELDLLPVDSEGLSHPHELEKIITDKTSVVSVMYANNETGVVADIKALAEIAHSRKALFHTDAVQAIGKRKVDVKDLDVDLLSLTAHKIYGPKGIGALYIRQGIKIAQLFHGGSHEKKRRPGTENVAGAVGLAKTLKIAGQCMEGDFASRSELSDYFIKNVQEKITDTKLNGSLKHRLPHTANLSFAGVEGESVVLSLDMDGIAVSSGSACHSGAVEPSRVLTSMGVDTVLALGAIRFSMGRSTTRKQIDYVLQKLPPVIQRLREMSPVYKKQK